MTKNNTEITQEQINKMTSDKIEIHKESFDLAGLISKVDTLEKENSRLRRQNLLVGVRWYGFGGIRLNLTYPINGKVTLNLEGYGANGVIDFVIWNKLKKSAVVNNGILVRDDKVIDELFVAGDIAPQDEEEFKNSFTDTQILSLLDSVDKKKIKGVIENITYFPILNRFNKFVKDSKCKASKDNTIVKLIQERNRYLEVKHRYDLLDKWDVFSACDSTGIPVEGRSVDELRESLINKEIKLLKEV